MSRKRLFGLESIAGSAVAGKPGQSKLLSASCLGMWRNCFVEHLFLANKCAATLLVRATSFRVSKIDILQCDQLAKVHGTLWNVFVPLPVVP